MLPLLLRFLADDGDEIASAVFPFALAILGVYKKERKRALGAKDPTEGMTPEKRAFLTQLLRVTLQKMEFGKDVEWEMNVEGEEDEEQLKFVELRHVRSFRPARCTYADTSTTESENDCRRSCFDRYFSPRRSRSVDRHCYARRLRGWRSCRRRAVLATNRTRSLSRLWFRSVPIASLTNVADAVCQARLSLLLDLERSYKCRTKMSLDRNGKANIDSTTRRIRSHYSER